LRGLEPGWGSQAGRASHRAWHRPVSPPSREKRGHRQPNHPTSRGCRIIRYCAVASFPLAIASCVLLSRHTYQLSRHAYRLSRNPYWPPPYLAAPSRLSWRTVYRAWWPRSHLVDPSARPVGPASHRGAVIGLRVRGAAQRVRASALSYESVSHGCIVGDSRGKSTPAANNCTALQNKSARSGEFCFNERLNSAPGSCYSPSR
jgi:hypothetical protein